MSGNRPSGREKHVTGGGSGVHRRGDGLGGGPVGSSGGKTPGFGGGSGKNSGGGGMRAAGGGSILVVIAAIAYFLFGGGLSGLSGGDTGVQQTSTLYGNLTGSSQSGWTDKDGNNTGVLNTEVADGSRNKYTTIKGNGKDQVTLMVYMCGTDLESRSGMATSDLQEMTQATLSDNVTVLVYTGGCKAWKNKVVSNSKNQIYQIKNGGVKCIVSDMGSDSMTKPKTLSTFIKWCTKNYPANRNELILWDHGGGSISGYGYDEKNASSGSMTLSGIKKALSDAGTTFDFIGFDACLMATTETAQLLSNYADYLIASEETEPGIGWYYTDWLTTLSKDTSIETIKLGKQIADDFVGTCAKKTSGQSATLSVVDLAELETTLPSALSAFSKSTVKLIENDEYATVSNARSSSREFSPSSRIDQIDFVHFADKVNTEESLALRDVLLSAVKYNKVSSNMTNSYGLSIYFPSGKKNKVDNMVTTYEDIGLGSDYGACISRYASMNYSGQAASGGTTTPFPTLFGSGSSQGSSSSSSSSGLDSEMMGQLLSTFLGGDFSSIAGLTSGTTSFMDKGLTEEQQTYITEHQIDTSKLEWTENDEGQNVLVLEEDQWNLVQMLALNMFYDDGEGYVDLGLDNVFDFDEDGNLIGETDHTWLAINGQVVAYYFEDQTEDENGKTITGKVPAMLNGEKVYLMISFDEENPYGHILGATPMYDEETTETIAKGLITLEKGDKLDFLCDFYTYDGQYQDNYYLGETMTVTDTMEISNVNVGSGDVIASYRLTDIYNQHYWTPNIP